MFSIFKSTPKPVDLPPIEVHTKKSQPEQAAVPQPPPPLFQPTEGEATLRDRKIEGVKNLAKKKIDENNVLIKGSDRKAKMYAIAHMVSLLAAFTLASVSAIDLIVFPTLAFIACIFSCVMNAKADAYDRDIQAKRIDNMHYNEILKGSLNGEPREIPERERALRQELEKEYEGDVVNKEADKWEANLKEERSRLFPEEEAV